MHGIEHAFGYWFSFHADLTYLPRCGNSFWDVAHGAWRFDVDGYARATGKISMVVAQNGPGIQD